MEYSVVCSIQRPESLPKNYALLKIVKKTKVITCFYSFLQESDADKNKRIVELRYREEEQKFVA